MIQRVVIDVDAGEVVRLKMPPDQHRSSLCDNLACRGGDWNDVQWAPDSVVGRLRFDLSRSSTDGAARRRSIDRRCARRSRRNREDVLRIRQRPHQLEIPAGVE